MNKNKPAKFDDILRLLESIPIDNGRLRNKFDKQFSLVDQGKSLEYLVPNLDDKTVSFKDILILLIKYLKGSDIDDSKIALGGRLNDLEKIGYTFPAQYVLFDYCLAALEGDNLDARLFLAHGLPSTSSSEFNLLLSVLVDTPLTEHKEVRELLTLIAIITQGAELDTYLELYGNDYRKRLDIFKNELLNLR